MTYTDKNLKELRAIALEKQLIIKGDKRKKQTYIDALTEADKTAIADKAIKEVREVKPQATATTTYQQLIDTRNANNLKLSEISYHYSIGSNSKKSKENRTLARQLRRANRDINRKLKALERAISTKQQTPTILAVLPIFAITISLIQSITQVF